MYTVKIAESRQLKTDQAIQHFLEKNPDCDVDEAIDALFQIGVAVILALSTDKPGHKT